MKKIGIFLAILLLLVIAAIFFANKAAERYVSDQLNSIQTNSFQFQYDSLSINVWNKSAELSNLTVIVPTKGITFTIKKLGVNQISITDLLFQDEIKIGSVDLIRPNFKKEQTTDTTKQRSDSSASPKKSNYQKLIIDKINILKGNLLFESKNLKEELNALHDVALSITQLEINDLNSISLKTISYSQFEGGIDSSTLFFKEFHHINTGNITFQSKKGLRLAQLSIQPIDSFQGGVAMPNYRVNWTDLAIDSVQIDLSWDSLIQSNYLYASSIELKKLQYKSFSDKNYKQKKTKVQQMPHEVIQRLGLRTTIAELSLIDGDVRYEEREEDAKENGRIEFKNISASIKNITNDSLALQNNAKLTAEFSTKLMGSSELNVSIDYDLVSTHGNHHIRGSLYNFELSKLNPAFRPLAFVEFKRGYLNKMEFNFSANNDRSDGKMDFIYDDMKVVFFDKKQIFKPNFLSSIETALANALVIRKANPLRGNLKKGTISFERNKEKSFLNFWWKSVFSGMKSTIVRGVQ